MTAQVNLPAPILGALEGGAALAISISGGKDSQAMALALVELHRTRGWTGDVFCITADLGSIEWPETAAHVQKIADMAGVPLVTVARARGGMVERWIQRGETTLAATGQGRPWSDSKNRFCTSELKRDPIDTYLRRYSNVVCAVGIRAQESDGRDKQPTHLVRKRITTRSRTAWTWHPIHAWSLLDVLRQCGHTWAELRDRQLTYRSGKTEQALAGWSMHPAYVYGNERLSCQFCVLGSVGDLANGARHNPELLEELIAIEDRFGFTFTGDRSLKSFRPQPARLAA
jgi:3'-phosphoadenosine 5'-phosphosulfate sulfotransferase (PAPS reductase)/FAD synthetase